MVDLDFLIVAMPYTLLDQSGLAEPRPVRGRGDRRRHRRALRLRDPRHRPRTRGALPLRDRRRGDPEADGGRSWPSAAGTASRCPPPRCTFPSVHPAVVSVIPGAAHPDEVRANIASFAAVVPADLWAELKDAGLLAGEVPTPS